MWCYVMQNNQNGADLVSVAKIFFHKEITRQHSTSCTLPSLWYLPPITYLLICWRWRGRWDSISWTRPGHTGRCTRWSVSVLVWERVRGTSSDGGIGCERACYWQHAVTDTISWRCWKDEQKREMCNRCEKKMLGAVYKYTDTASATTLKSSQIKSSPIENETK